MKIIKTLENFNSSTDSKIEDNYYIKGVRPNGKICIFNGSHNPYDISLNTPPSGYIYDDKHDAISKMNSIKNQFVKIEWSVITESEFIKIRLDWCKNYIKHYEKNNL
jgi:hypothetical protein